MTINKKLSRRKLLVTSAAFSATSAAGVMPVSAASGSEATDAFYRGSEFTFCDAKYLSNMWGKSIGESKVVAGEKILDFGLNYFRGQLNTARRIGLQKGIRCEFEDANNPEYSYSDVEKLARYWNSPSFGDAKLKIRAMLEQGMNKDIQSDLRKAQ